MENVLETMRVKDAYKKAEISLATIGWRIDREWFEECHRGIWELRDQLDRLEAELQKLTHHP